MPSSSRKAWTRKLAQNVPIGDWPETGFKYWPITPRPAPRQSERDKFNPSPMVKRYRAFCNEVNWLKVWPPTPGDLVIFFVPMPKSWTKRKKAELLGQPNSQVPDVDNYLKALLDACYGNDAHIWTITPAKVWHRSGGIYIERREPDLTIDVILDRIIGDR